MRTRGGLWITELRRRSQRQASCMHEIPDELAREPFTLSRAAELGIPARVLDGARFARPWPGVRVVRDHPDTLLERCRAAHLILPPSAVFSHGTALHVGGWDVPWQPEGKRLRYSAPEPGPGAAIHVSVPPGTARPHGKGVVGHAFTPLEDDVIQREGLPITSPWRTWCDLAAGGASEVDLVILADALRRRDQRAAAYLAQRLEDWGRGRRVRVLRQALALSRDRVDSPMETRLRLVFVETGLPQPEVNRWVRLPDGTGVHCPDLSWPQWRVAADYDGAHHFDRDDVEDVRIGRASDWRQRTDITRRDQLDDIGWTLRVFTSFDVYRRALLSAERMRMALRRAGAPV
jgi:hypothetical protein